MTTLKGIRVLDSSHTHAGFISTMFMAAMGSEVIKIELDNASSQSRRKAITRAIKTILARACNYSPSERSQKLQRARFPLN